MECNSAENSERPCSSSSRLCDSSVTTMNLDSPKVSRVPLQQMTSPAMSSKIQMSITPYRYHRCRVIQEEAAEIQENQENIDPQPMKCEEFDSSEPNPGCTTTDAGPAAVSSSPFTYPLILEGHQSISSMPGKSPMRCSKITHQSVITSPLTYSGMSPRGITNNYESPKTHFVTPHGKSCVNYVDRLHARQTKCDLENQPERHHSSRLRSNSGHFINNSGASISRGLVSSGSSCGSSSNSGCSCSNRISTITPSKSIHTPSSADISVFRTPSETCSSGASENRLLTPQQRYLKYQVLNPFELGVDHLQLPAVSPSLFRPTVSPSPNGAENFRWSIDELAVLKPVNIETSPFNQHEIHLDPDYENEAQAAIDKFFSKQPVVPSPWTGNNKVVSLLPMISSAEKVSSCQPSPNSRTVSCQTELTLPMVLPEALEEALKPFFTYTQDQWWQNNNEAEEGTNLNNTTLRRKLLFSPDELVNATPMCSPRGAPSPDGNCSLSPVAPLPLHDDDDCQDIEEDDGAELMWSTDVCSDFTNPGEPRLRHIPPTPPSTSGQTCLQNAVTELHHSGCYGPFQSPGSGEFVNASPNVSPVGREPVSTSPHLIFSSPDVSPIQATQGNHSQFLTQSVSDSIARPAMLSFTNSESFVVLSPDGACVNKSRSLINSDFLLDSDLLRKSGSFSGSPTQLMYARQNVNMHHTTEFEPNIDPVPVIDVSGGNTNPGCRESVHSSSTNSSSISSVSSSPNNSAIVESNTVPNTHCSSNMILPEMNQNSSSYSCNTQTNYSEKSHDIGANYASSGCEQNAAIQLTPTSSKADKRSSGNSGHFSSSPIRDVHQSPLSVDTPCKRFTDSPPLSPILCRSMSIQHQLNAVKAQNPCIQDCHYVERDMLQSTLLSVDMDARNRTAEEMSMDEGLAVSAASTLDNSQGGMLVNNRGLADSQEFSYICDMDTDLQQSLDGNTSLGLKSQESGYQTGSLQSTNFSMSTFAGNSTACTSLSFQKDRQPSIFCSDTPNVQAQLTNVEKRTRNQSGLPYKGRIIE